MFLANPVYRVRSHPSAWHLKTFQWHGWTRSSNNSIFLFEIYQFFVGKYSTFIYNPQALLESEKNANVIRFADLVHRVRRDPSVTLRKFSPDTTGHGLQITKRPAVWYFSTFLFEKYQFLLKIFYLHLESSSLSRKWKNLNVVLFAYSVHRVRRDPSVTQFSRFATVFDFHDSYLWIYELNQDLKLFSRFDKLFKSDLSRKIPILHIFSDLQSIFGLPLLLVMIPISS